MKNIRFVDCGANVGQSIDWAIDTFKLNKLIVDSFEPHPVNFQILTEKYGQFTNVNLHSVAVSTMNGEATFYPQNWGARTGSSLVKGKPSTSIEEAFTVKTINLSEWIKNHSNENEKIILKIDIEGHEYDLLPHLLNNEIHHIVSCLIIEYHSEKLTNKIDFMAIENEVFRKMKVFDWKNPNIIKNDVIDYINRS